MPIQKINNQCGNRANHRIFDLRNPGVRAARRAELRTRYENRINNYRALRDEVLGGRIDNPLDEILGPDGENENAPPRQANRRKTDSAGGPRHGDFFNHDSMRGRVEGPMISIGEKIREDEEFARVYAAETAEARAYGARRQAEKAKEMEGEA